MKKSKIISSIVLLATLLFANNTYAQKLESEFLYKITLTLDKPIDTGHSPFRTRIGYPIKGGTFEGPKMKGKVKAVGEDWLMKVDETTNKLDVRFPPLLVFFPPTTTASAHWGERLRIPK